MHLSSTKWGIVLIVAYRLIVSVKFQVKNAQIEASITCNIESIKRWRLSAIKVEIEIELKSIVSDYLEFKPTHPWEKF